MDANLNLVERKLKEIYDNWDKGKQLEGNPEYSSMFRMGFPDDYTDNKKPLMMYVGQECLNCNPKKSQEWIRLYQTVQFTKQKMEYRNEILSTNRSPFWNFYRRLTAFEYNVVWNNLDKFHPQSKQRLDVEKAIELNSPYLAGDAVYSVLQREIRLLNPSVVILAIGKDKYIESLSSAFSLDSNELRKFQPTEDEPVHEVTNQLGINPCRVFWTYHPAFLQRHKKYFDVLSFLEKALLQS